jgi:hypothetical protein
MGGERRYRQMHSEKGLIVVRTKNGRHHNHKSLREQLQGIVHDYMREFGVEAVDLDTVAGWAVEAGRYRREPASLVRRCKSELSRAMRAEHFTDAQGREVRLMHAARLPFGEEGSIVVWADIRKAKPHHMEISFQQRRHGIVRDALQHKTDVASYNDNNTYGVSLPLFDYNINKDLAELEAPGEYPDENPEG